MSKPDIYQQKWKIVKCRSKNCWCRLVVLPSYNSKTDLLDDCVILGGCVETELAKYIVKLHNKNLKGK